MTTVVVLHPCQVCPQGTPGSTQQKVSSWHFGWRPRMLLDIPEFTDDPTTELSDPLHQWCRGWETLPSRLLGFHFQNGITIITTTTIMGLPDSSAGKEATCNAGDLGSIPGSGRSTGEGKGCPLQYSWASLVVQLVKNPPAVRKMWVQYLGWD